MSAAVAEDFSPASPQSEVEVEESEYERMFSGREQRVGRPVGSGGDDVAFSFRDKDRRLATQAKSRVYAMLIARNRQWAREAFENEYRILAQRQGYEEIEVRKHTVEVERVRRELGAGV